MSSIDSDHTAASTAHATPSPPDNANNEPDLFIPEEVGSRLPISDVQESLPQPDSVQLGEDPTQQQEQDNFAPASIPIPPGQEQENLAPDSIPISTGLELEPLAPYSIPGPEEQENNPLPPGYIRIPIQRDPPTNPTPTEEEPVQEHAPIAQPEFIQIPIERIGDTSEPEEEDTPSPSPSPASTVELENPDISHPSHTHSTPPTSPTNGRGANSFEEEPLIPKSPSDKKKSSIEFVPAEIVSAKAPPEDDVTSGRSATYYVTPEAGKDPSTSRNSRRKRSRMATSIEDIGSLRLWKGIVAEFLGTLLLTLVGCGSCINLRGEDNVTSPVVQIALCFGLSVATIVWAIAHVSGGHINPAVTVAMLATRKISIAKAVFFIIFQLLGAIVGAGILMGLTPGDYHGNLGSTLVSDKITSAQAFGVEFLITFVLVFVVFASCDGKRRDLNGSIPLTIGLAVTMCHLFAIDYTGSSMNTARSFGPAVVNGNWDNHWVYWAGPILGGVVAGVLYDVVFAANASLTKAKACLLSSNYDDERYQAQKLKVRIIEEDPEDEMALSGKDSDPANSKA